MECPWDSFRQSELVFCEDNRCAWIREPANTWSNLAYVAAGIYITVALGRRTDRPLLRMLALVAVATGIGSGFYHASGIYWGMLADYGGMFLGTAALTALNLRRWLGWGGPAVWGALATTTAVLLGAAVMFPGSERHIFMVAMPCCLIELRLYFRDRRSTSYRFYGLAWASVAIGTAFWMLDLTRVWCAPSNHLVNGHALWHVATAGSLVLYFHHYLQFGSLREAQPLRERAGVAARLLTPAVPPRAL